jgi:hypothetical protein
MGMMRTNDHSKRLRLSKKLVFENQFETRFDSIPHPVPPKIIHNLNEIKINIAGDLAPFILNYNHCMNLALPSWHLELRSCQIAIQWKFGAKTVFWQNVPVRKSYPLQYHTGLRIWQKRKVGWKWPIQCARQNLASNLAGGTDIKRFSAQRRFR